MGSGWVVTLLKSGVLGGGSMMWGGEPKIAVKEGVAFGSCVRWKSSSQGFKALLID